MPVVAMTREMGSRGRDVARGLAEQLALQIVHHEVVEHIADRMHLRESSVDRFLEGRAGLFERWRVNERDLLLYTSAEILELAEKGDVIIRGWGATYMLHDIAHVPCVRICAPLELRVKEVMERMGLEDAAVARKEVRRNDAAHARAMSHQFHVDYTDPMLYDVVLNTERTSVADCVAIIRGLLESDSFRETPRSRAMLAHRKVEAAVRSALRSNKMTSETTPSFESRYYPETGVVVLSGIALNDEFKAEAERVARAVPGVKDVRNEMIVIRPSAYGGP